MPGTPCLRPYDLRHAALSLWLASGAPPPEVAARAGHSVRVLLTVYSHCAPSGDEIASQHTRRGTLAGNGQACRADLVAATGQFSRPPAGSFMAISGQFLVTAVTAVF